MKNISRILLSILSFSYLSCSSDKGDDPSQFLTVDIGKSNAILIPSPATTLSCEQIAKGDVSTGAIAGSYFTLPNPNITWTDPVGAADATASTSEIRIVVFKLTLKSPKVGGEYSCVFSDLALGSWYFKRNQLGDNLVVTTWDGKLGKNSANTVNSTRTLTTEANREIIGCDIKCGGITVPKGAGQFSVTGEYELLAVQKKYSTATDYEEFPIKVIGSFTVENTLN